MTGVPPSLDEIVKEISKWQEALAHVSVVYAYVQEFSRGAYFRRSEDRRRTLLRCYQLDGSKIRYYSQTVSIDGAPLQHSPPIVYCDPEVFQKWWPQSRLAIETPLTSNSMTLDDIDLGCEWLDCLGFWPRDDHPVQSLEFYIPKAFDSGAYHVQSQAEWIDGRRCWVVERPEIDKLWLDSDRGCVPVKRVWRPARPSDKLGETIYRAHDFELWDYREVAEGVWLPWMTRRDMLVDSGRSGEGLIPILSNVAIVGNIKLNEQITRSSYLPGTKVTIIDHSAAGNTKLIPGGEELLDEISLRYCVNGPPKDIHSMCYWLLGGLIVESALVISLCR